MHVRTVEIYNKTGTKHRSLTESLAVSTHDTTQHDRAVKKRRGEERRGERQQGHRIRHVSGTTKLITAGTAPTSSDCDKRAEIQDRRKRRRKRKRRRR